VGPPHAPPLITVFVAAPPEDEGVGEVALGAFEGASGKQPDAPPALYVPAAQLKHAALDTLFVLGLNVPAAQLEHEDAPPVLYLPAAHATQAEGGEAYVPAGQDVPVKAQDVAPATLYAPAAHKVQQHTPKAE